MAAGGSIVDQALARSPGQSFMLRRSSRSLAVLGYHAIDDADAFAAQLDWLVQNAHAVPIDEAVPALNGRRSLPDRAVLITFDDGHRSVYETAFPLLRERGLPAVVYVVAGLLDSQTPFWWTEVEQLAAAGGRVRGWEGNDGRELARRLKRVPNQRRLAALAELRATASAPAALLPQLRSVELAVMEANGLAVGNHSLTHPSLIRCSTEEIDWELEESHRLLTEAIGRAPESFAYPNGDADERVVHAVRRAGYGAAFLFDHKLTQVPARDPLRVSRLQVKSTTSLARFQIILSGLNPTLHRVFGRPLRGAQVRLRRQNARARRRFERL